jgi:hypothetical protein
LQISTNLETLDKIRKHEIEQETIATAEKKGAKNETRRRNKWRIAVKNSVWQKTPRAVRGGGMPVITVGDATL